MAQKQTTGIIPEHFLGKAVLKMHTLELQEFVESQLAENPALTLRDVATCPVCGGDLSGGRCLQCGSCSVEDYDSQSLRYWETEYSSPDSGFSEEFPEPFSAVASPQNLTDYLKEQIRIHLPENLHSVANFIAESLDEDGYLREPLMDIADCLCLSVPQVENVLHLIQSLDPPGIAARNLRECLLIQLNQLDMADSNASLARVIISEHWELLTRMRLDKLAADLHVSKDEISSSLDFMRRHLNPYPASVFRDPWSRFVPSGSPRTMPDIIVRHTGEGLTAEIADSISHRISVDDTYDSLVSEMSQKRQAVSDSDWIHVRESVSKARLLIEALEFRKTTLRKIADELLNYQAEFFTKGPSALKPMTKKELAQKLGLHESTICRATQDKAICLPSGETIPLEMLFDAALPVKELIRNFCAERLNDGEIVQRLRELGINIARRTVAKYRNQIGIPRADYRVA